MARRRKKGKTGSARQRRAMGAACKGRGTLGIPKGAACNWLKHKKRGKRGS